MLRNVQDRSGLQISRLRIIIRSDRLNNETVFSPLKDRRVVLINRHATFRMVARVMRAIVIRAINYRRHVAVCRACVLARRNRLQRTIVVRVISVSGRNIALLRARVTRYLREVCLFRCRHAVARRMRAIVLRPRQASRCLRVEARLFIYLHLVYMRRVSTHLLLFQHLHLFLFGQIRFPLLQYADALLFILHARRASTGRT